MKWKRKQTIRKSESFRKVILLLSQKNFWNSFSLVDESYYCITRFCWKIFLITSLIRNDRKCWLWGFFPTQFPDIICNKIWYIILEIFFNKFSVALLFGNIDQKLRWKILNLAGEKLFLVRVHRPNFLLFFCCVFL